MNISLSGPKGKNAVLTVGNKNYIIEGFEGNLGYQLPFGLISCILSNEDFEIKNKNDDLKIVSTKESLVITFAGKITIYPIINREFAKAISRDIRINARDWATPNASYKKKTLSEEEYTKYASRFKHKEEKIISELNWLDDLLADSPIYHTLDELENLKKGLIE